MANVIIIDVNKNMVLSYLTSVSSPDFEGRADVLINPDTKLVDALPIRYWKVSGKSVVPMDQDEMDAVDEAIRIEQVTANRGSAKAFFFAQSGEGVIWRATLTWLASGVGAADLSDAVSQIQAIIDSGQVDS